MNKIGLYSNIICMLYVVWRLHIANGMAEPNGVDAARAESN